jgi:hypothetical protein
VGRNFGGVLTPAGGKLHEIAYAKRKVPTPPAKREALYRKRKVNRSILTIMLIAQPLGKGKGLGTF